MGKSAIICSPPRRVSALQVVRTPFLGPRPRLFPPPRHPPLQNLLEILSHTCQYKIFETYLGNWGCVIAVNLQISFETSSPQQVNNVPKLPHVNYAAKNWALVMMFKALPLAHLKQQMIISVKKHETRLSNERKIYRFLGKFAQKILTKSAVFYRLIFGKVSPENSCEISPIVLSICL